MGRGHLGSNQLLPEARRPPVGNHRRLGENLLELRVAYAFHHGAVAFDDDARDGGEGWVVQNRKNITLLMASSRGIWSFVDVLVDTFPFLAPGEQYVMELRLSLISLSGNKAY